MSAWIASRTLRSFICRVWQCHSLESGFFYLHLPQEVLWGWYKARCCHFWWCAFMHPPTCNSDHSDAALQSCHNTDISLQHKWARIQPSHTIELKARARPITSPVYYCISDRVWSIDGFRFCFAVQYHSRDDIVCIFCHEVFKICLISSFFVSFCVASVSFVFLSSVNLITIC